MENNQILLETKLVSDIKGTFLCPHISEGIGGDGMKSSGF